jgi:hypothetical protein
VSEQKFIVYGYCGEYSDHTLWPVAVFDSEDDASVYALRCAALREEIAASPDFSDPGSHPHLRTLDPSAPYSFSYDVTYAVWDLPWFRELPDGLAAKGPDRA